MWIVDGDGELIDSEGFEKNLAGAEDFPKADVESTVSSDDATFSQNRRVLVVDSHRDSAASLKLFLELSGHEVTIAHSTRAAIYLAHGTRPRTIILDVGKNREGYAVARGLRASPIVSDCLLIAISCENNDAEREEARIAGFDFCFLKPVDPRIFSHLLAGH